MAAENECDGESSTKMKTMPRISHCSHCCWHPCLTNG